VPKSFSEPEFSLKAGAFPLPKQVYLPFARCVLAEEGASQFSFQPFNQWVIFRPFPSLNPSFFTRRFPLCI